MTDQTKEVPGLQWMYDGPKSLTNREDYLLGKKIDKNFVMYSDVVLKDRDDNEELFTKRSTDKPANESLPIHVVRQEDPLAEIKIRQEKRRQEMLNNPTFRQKAEKLFKKEFEKAQRKVEKKAKRKAAKKEKKR